MKPDDEDLAGGREAEELVRKRQRERATLMALLLGALVLLVFAVSITRIREGMPEGARAATDKGPSGTSFGRPSPAPVQGSPAQ